MGLAGLAIVATFAVPAAFATPGLFVLVVGVAILTTLAMSSFPLP